MWISPRELIREMILAALWRIALVVMCVGAAVWRMT